MGRRRVKKRTHGGVGDGHKPGDKTPKSMVIRIGAGEVGSSVSQLAKDLRQVMEPHTASRLRERKANKLRDYTTMCGPLGVTHLFLVSRSSSGNVNLRIAISPRGPTLHFRIQNYSLCKDVLRSMRRPKTGSKEAYMNPPLLVMNNFSSAPPATNGATTDDSKKGRIPKHLESLITTVFQSVFPPISPQSTPLSSIRRILLLDRLSAGSGLQTSEDQTYTLFLRHYHISTRPAGLPRSIKRLQRAERAISGDASRRAPDLGRLQDVSDYFLGEAAAGYTSASDTELDTDAEVEVIQAPARKVLGRRERDEQRAKAAAAVADGEEGEAAPAPQAERARVEKRAVKMTELGPRIKLRLTKVEDGLCGGKVLWHEFVTKTRDEEKQLDAMWERRNAERAERRRVQRENVERKRAEKAAKGKKTGAGEEEEEEEDEEDLDDMDLDDDEWFDDGGAEGDEVNGEAEDEDAVRMGNGEE